MIMEAVLFPLVGLLTSINLTVLGILFRRMNMLDERLRQAPSREEVEKTVDTKLEAVKVLQQEIKEDIKYMRHQLEKIAESKK